MENVTLTARHKSVPPRLWGTTAADAVAAGLRLAEFTTPVLTLDARAEAHNVRLLTGWASERGLELAPHGKTTMSPQLWGRLREAGAAAITLATPWQVQVARSVGVDRILLANELADPGAIAWLAAELDADPGFEFACWIDSAEGLAALARSAGERPIDVLVELGAAGGRTGVRRADPALALAWAASQEPRVRLVGVSGYEGSYATDRSPESVAAVRDYLGALVALFEQIDAFGLFELQQPILTAGGSAWFDLVAEAMAPLAGRARRILRSGAFQAHDDVMYAAISPFADGEADARFAPALAVWARVVSRPEPTLALLDAGKRDVPYDTGLPVPQHPDGSPMAGAHVRQVADQHSFLVLPADSTLAFGDVVRLGISHPCTAFDKWRLIPVVDDASADEPRVVDFVETLF